MDTSEKWECYVFGQCEVGFKAHTAGLGMKHGFMVSVCIFLPVEGADNAIFTSVTQHGKSLSAKHSTSFLSLFKHFPLSILQEYSVNFEKIDNAESCHKFCGKNDDCKWWTWVQENSLCSLFANCTDPKQSTGHPNVGTCSDCISGQQA